MYAQQLRTPITIQQRQSGTDDYGQPVETWQDFAENVRADIRHLSGTETIKADALAPVTRTSIRIRYITGVTAGMRVLAGVSTYEIRHIMPDIKNSRYVDMACEVVNGGY